MAADSAKRSTSVFGLSLKQAVLVALTVQNSISILVMHYSRTMPLVNGQRYFPSTAVFLNELIKLPICLSMALFEIASNPKTADTSTVGALFGEVVRAAFSGDSWKLAIPAMLYTLQNSLQYVAISNLEAATYQVMNQLKILTTAMFSVVLLGRVLTGRKWSSLFLLMLGVATVHLSEGAGSATLTIKDLQRDAAFQRARHNWDLKGMGAVAAGVIAKRSASYEGMKESQAWNKGYDSSLGFISIVGANVLSGLASVYFEKVLKEPRTEYGNSVWIRNVQLSFYSLWPALFIGVMFKDGEHITKSGFFTGYNWVVWSTIFLQAAGGLLVAFVVKFANNITKIFATSISIILSFLASVFFFDFEITPFYVIGTATVISATYIYNTTATATTPKSPLPKVPEEAEKSTSDPLRRDSEPLLSTSKIPMRSEARSSSRPSTPAAVERVPHRVKSLEMRVNKRGE